MWLTASNRRHKALIAVVPVTGLVLGLAACSSSSSVKPVSAKAKQTIVFAESGLGTEAQQTQVAINAFMKANPNITVKIDVLSPDSTTYLSQLEHSFIAGATTPDVFETDVTYPAKFAQAGWVPKLTQFNPDMSQFFPHEVAAGTFQGVPYAVPWFDNPEGLYYRTDLIKTPPASPAQVVADAQAALKKDHSLKEGLAFEGVKYEGAITAFLTVDSAFGGKLDPSNVDTAGNKAALIPNEIYEAARVDGASAWQAFRRLTLPMLKPALIFRTLQALLVFDVIYIMTGGGPGNSTETLSFLNFYTFINNTNFGLGGAISVMLVVLALIVSWGYVRVFRPSPT